MPFYKVDTDSGRINLYFEEIPSYAARNLLKANGWWWDPDGQCWWNHISGTSQIFAEKLCPETPKTTSQQSAMEGLFQKGSCGRSAAWLLSQTGYLIIGGNGEIKGYDYDQRDSSPWSQIRDQIRHIKIRDGITSIGKRAFYCFSNLEEVELSDSVISIGDRAFSRCYNLKFIRLSQNLEHIGSQAFRDCTSLREIHLPETVSEIGEDCFKNWKATQTIYRLQRGRYTGRLTELPFSPDTAHSSSQEIYFEDFVTVTTNSYCVNNGHDFENVQAKVNILCRDGTVRTVTVPAGYCKTCKKYFIGLWQFENLRKIGVLLCRLVDETSTSGAKGSVFYSGLSPESLLKQYGYSVNSVENLSDEQRRQILVCLVESGICPRQKITSHLSWLIQSREGRADLMNAVSKWKADRSFIDSYKIGSGRVVAMRSLRTRR